MKVFKFGGASVKDADGIRNVGAILTGYLEQKPVIVVSAMGKVTNALEEVVKAVFTEPSKAISLIENLRDFHNNTAKQLLPSNHSVFEEIDNICAELYWAAEETQRRSWDYEYDQIVSAGELLSSKILAAYLSFTGIPVVWKDARDLIRTDETFREAKIDWQTSEKLIQQQYSLLQQQKPGSLMLTQGFIGGTNDNETTTLGREGSDYSAAILAYCLQAEEVVIWKDVPGVLNADPKAFPNAVLLDEISYYDAIELAYYGATVIHPKTLKPLQNKNIPLRVKSFVQPQMPGTTIGRDDYKNSIPTFIFKKDQVLLSISPRDFSFIIEENIRDIFEQLAIRRIKVNLMQNSALKFSICINNDQQRIPGFIEEINSRYKVLYNEGCELVTVRNHTDELARELSAGKSILVEQRSRNTLQMVLAEKSSTL